VSTIAIAHGSSVPDGEANSFGIVLLIIYTLHMSSCCVKAEHARPSENISIVCLLVNCPLPIHRVLIICHFGLMSFALNCLAN
jgi:hypothetical protein